MLTVADTHSHREPQLLGLSMVGWSGWMDGAQKR